MKRILPILSVLVALSAAAAAEDKVVAFSSEDANMNAAIAKARASLPQFWEKFAKPAANETDFGVKLGISDGTQTEHFWCSDIQGDAKSATCAIANEPQLVFKVKMGERVTIEPVIISDWMYRQNGKIKGGETIRVIIPQLAPEEAEYYKSMLADQ